MSSAHILERADAGMKRVALKPETPHDERQIRQGMRLRPRAKSSHVLQISIIGGAALLAGGFCLGWKVSRFWH